MMRMKFNVLTLFPEMFTAVTKDSILGKANEKGIIDVNLIDIREYSADKHKKVDDTPFGGGVGMTMFCQPVFDCLNELKPKKVIYMSPRGKIMDMDMIKRLSGEEEVTILCGHYEGVDQRIIDYFNMEEVSIGDYVLTGGEIPAMALIDAVSRFIPGVLGEEESATDESIYSGLLEADQYTKPQEYMGMKVPEVLTSGNHKNIALWKLENSIRLTAERRPDLFMNWVESKPDLSQFTRREREGIMRIINQLLKKKDQNR